jgi:type II secretory pathway pseudopilin PulG
VYGRRRVRRVCTALTGAALVAAVITAPRAVGQENAAKKAERAAVDCATATLEMASAAARGEGWIHDDGNVSRQLLRHYYGKSGRPVVIDWSFFSGDADFMAFARSRPVDGGEQVYAPRADADGMDMVLGLNHFAVSRTSADCYAVRDFYDFDPDSRLAGLKQAALDGKAEEFEIRSSGCQP